MIMMRVLLLLHLISYASAAEEVCKSQCAVHSNTENGDHGGYNVTSTHDIGDTSGTWTYRVCRSNSACDEDADKTVKGLSHFDLILNNIEGMYADCGVTVTNNLVDVTLKMEGGDCGTGKEDPSCLRDGPADLTFAKCDVTGTEKDCYEMTMQLTYPLKEGFKIMNGPIKAKTKTGGGIPCSEDICIDGPVCVRITPTPTPEPTAEPTPEPTAEPTPEPTSEATPEPTSEATPEPTAEPTPEPTPPPSTAQPTPPPTEFPCKFTYSPTAGDFNGATQPDCVRMTADDVLEAYESAADHHTTCMHPFLAASFYFATWAMYYA